MTKEQMEKTLKDVVLLEKDLMRDLTEEEANLVCEKGFKALFDTFEFDDQDYKTLRYLRKLIATYCTGKVEDYESLLAEDSYSTLAVLKTIVNDLEQHQELEPALAATTENTVYGGYDENKDPELKEYFNAQSTEEAKEAKTSYDPEDDKDLLAPEDFLKEYQKSITQFTGKFKYFDLDDIISKLVDGKKVSGLTFDQMQEIKKYIASHYDNYSIKIINDTMQAKIKH